MVAGANPPTLMKRMQLVGAGYSLARPLEKHGDPTDTRIFRECISQSTVAQGNATERCCASYANTIEFPILCCGLLNGTI